METRKGLPIRQAVHSALSRRRFLQGSIAVAGIPALAALTAACGDSGPGPDPVEDIESCPAGEWNTAIKTTVCTAFTYIPGAGPLLANIARSYWPPNGCPGTPVQQQLKSEMESLLGQVVDQDAMAIIDDMSTLIGNYLQVVQSTTDPLQHFNAWSDCNNSLGIQDAQFQLSGFEVLLLPLYVMYGTAYLHFVRDAQLNEAVWSKYDGWLETFPTLVTEFLQQAVPYCNRVYAWGYQQYFGPTADYHGCQPFRSANQYRSILRANSMDFVQMWPLLDYSKYHQTLTPEQVVPVWEVYDGPYGTADDSGLINLPLVPPTDFPVTMVMDSGSRIDAVQVTYPQGKGPNGVTTTPKMGGNGGGPTLIGFGTPTSGGGTTYLTGAVITSGNIVNSALFNYSNGETTSQFGSTSGGVRATASHDNSRLSSVYINGVSNSYKSADCLILGFTPVPSQFLTAQPTLPPPGTVSRRLGAAARNPGG